MTDALTPYAAGLPADIDDEPGLTGAQKAAIVLASLSVEIAGPIVENMTDKELRAFAVAFSSLRSVAPDQLNAVASEFVSVVSGRLGELEAGSREAEKILKSLTDEPRANRVLKRAKAEEDADDVWSRLVDVDDDALAAFISGQKPSIAGVILGRIAPHKSAAVVGALEPEVSRAALMEIARRPSVPEATLEAIGQAIDEALLQPLARRADFSKGGAAVGEIVNFLPSQRREALLEALGLADPAIADAVRKVVLTFADLEKRLPPSAVPTVTREIDRSVLLEALLYGQKAAPATVEFIFANMSKRLGDELKEDMEGRPQLDDENGERAHREFTAAVRRLVGEGAFDLFEESTEEDD